MKNQHQSHCRLVEHIYQADFALKTCKQADESQRGWSSPGDPPREEVLGRRRMRAGGFCRGRIHGSLGIPWVAACRCCDGSLKETPTPQPHNQRSGVRGKCCALLFTKRTTSGKVSADEQTQSPSCKDRAALAPPSPVWSPRLPTEQPFTPASMAQLILQNSRDLALDQENKSKRSRNVSALPAEIKSLSLTSYQA